MLKTKLFVILAVLSLVLFIGIALAQENEGTNNATTEEEITAQDLGVSEPRILPGNPFYFLKEWGRNIQSFFTFNPVAKAGLKEKFASEKLMEVKKMVEQKKTREKIEEAVQNYQNEIEEAKKTTEKITETAEENEAVGKFLDKFIQHQILHQEILQKLEEQVPAETFEKIKEAREMHLEKFEEVMNKLEENKEQLQERLEKNIQEMPGAKEKLIQIKNRILEKVQEKGLQR